MVSRKHYYHSIQRQSRCKDDVFALDTDDDTVDDTNDDTNDDTDDGGCGHLYTIKVPGCCCWVK